MDRVLFKGIVWIACLLSQSVFGQSPQFVETSFGFAAHSIEARDGGSLTSTGEYLNLSAGLQLKHTLSMSSSLRIWSTEEDTQEDSIEHTLFHNFHFAGISLGVEGQMFLPTLKQGPYAKVGRHCWAVGVSQFFNIWDGSGCSNIVGGGWMLNAQDEAKVRPFFEVMLTRFKYVNSWMLIAGARF